MVEMPDYDEPRLRQKGKKNHFSVNLMLDL